MNFPYNNHKVDDDCYEREPNGSPLSYNDAFALAATVHMWHMLHDTDTWSQSGDRGYIDEVDLAYGLLELLSDPGAVNRLILSGKSVRNRVHGLFEVFGENGTAGDTKRSDYWDKAVAVVEGVFGTQHPD